MTKNERRLFPTCKCGRPCPIGKRKCGKCLKTKMRKTKGRDSNRGRNAQGIALHRPTKGARNKRFYTTVPPISEARMDQLDKKRRLRDATTSYDQLVADQVRGG